MQITVKNDDNTEVTYDITKIEDEQKRNVVNMNLEKIRFSDFQREVYSIATNAYSTSLQNTLKECPEAVVEPEVEVVEEKSE